MKAKNRSDNYGINDSRKMPKHFFFNAIRLDHSTAIQADTEKQDYTVCPRHWYVDAYFKCKGCDTVFLWSAVEQKTWFEEYKFLVHSQATHCLKCRAQRRQLTALKKEYDHAVATARNSRDVAEKKKVIAIIDQMAAMTGTLPEKVSGTRDELLRQIKNVELRLEGQMRPESE
jgi:thiol-disulfide isomerase/thioredoxin